MIYFQKLANWSLFQIFPYHRDYTQLRSPENPSIIPRSTPALCLITVIFFAKLLVIHHYWFSPLNPLQLLSIYSYKLGAHPLISIIQISELQIPIPQFIYSLAAQNQIIIITVTLILYNNCQYLEWAFTTLTSKSFASQESIQALMGCEDL